MITMPKTKRIGLVAHDNCKTDMVDWVRHNREILSRHHLFGTGTTGKKITEELDLPVNLFLSGPLGGDQQLGAAIAEKKLDMLIFFWDPLNAHPHDVDVKALLRIAALYNIPMACNRSSADFFITSPLMMAEYERKVPANLE